MADRIYVTYTPTAGPESFHTAIHYVRTGPTGEVIKHVVVEAKPGNELSVPGKVVGFLEEAFRDGDDASRFGNIHAKVRDLAESNTPTEASDDPNAPIETIAEGDDLSENLARIQLYAYGFNRAGFAYRGGRQNSNTFASAALQAGKLPSATGVAHDPAGPPGELLEFFAPGLNEPLRPSVGQRSSNENGKGVQYTSVPELGGEAFRESVAHIAGRFNAFGTGFSSPAADDLTALGQGIARPRGVGQLPSQPMLPSQIASNFPGEESAFGDRSENVPGAARAHAYPQLRRVSSAFAGIAPPGPNEPAPSPEHIPPLGIFSGKPMSFVPFPLPLGGPQDKSGESGDGSFLDFLAGLASRSRPPASSQPRAAGMPIRTLGRIVDQPHASALDAAAPLAPLAPSDNANFSGGLLGRLTASAGLDSQNPMQPAPPPLDEQLRGFDRDNPAQPWFAQLQR